MDKSINIAILGNCTTEYIAQALQDECEKKNIFAYIYNAPYDQYNQEILNIDSGLYTSKPEITILFLESFLLFPQWFEFTNLTSDKDNKLSQIQSAFDKLISLIEKIHANSDTKIIMNNFKLPYHSPLGLLDGKYYPGIKDMISMLNMKLNEWSADKEYLFVFDYNGISAQFGHKKSVSQKMIYLANNPATLAFTHVLAGEYMRYILPLKFMSKKCLVLDLDNTLWGGVAGEDGISGIELDITGPGKSYYDFQKEILNLYNKGILLALNSKNNFDDAISIIENHPHMLLRPSHFSSLKINWNDKAKNISEIAKELNIGIDSIVFFDDNPVERELVKTMLPDVTVISVPNDSSKYADTLKNLVEFEMLMITKEDIQRNEMYFANLKRNESISQYKSIDDYLASLEMKIILEYANEFSIPRIAQLTQKTNQFNMTTKRYLDKDIESMAKSEQYMVISCQAIDRLGDNGITGVCIAYLEGANAEIDTYLLSCRILGRNIEYAFIHDVIRRLRNKGIQKIYASYIRTDKNKANENFYEKAGFSKYLWTGSEAKSGLPQALQNDDTNKMLYCIDSDSQLKGIPYIEVI